MTKLKKKSLTTLFLNSISSAISLWANLLAIFAVIVLTGMVDINVKPDISILSPTYIVQKNHLRENLIKSNYPLTDSLIENIFGSKSAVVVNIPTEKSIFLKSGGIVSNHWTVTKGKNKGKDFYYKELRNESTIFRTSDVGYNFEQELNGTFLSPEKADANIIKQSELDQKNKRIQVMPFFAKYIIDNYGSDWLYLSNDSILKIENKLALRNAKLPNMLSSALFKCRKVFSIISIENYSSFDIKGFKLRVFKKRDFFENNKLKLEAWTLSDSEIDSEQLEGNEVSVSISNIQKQNDIQIIISSKFFQIKDEDLLYSFEKLQSMNINIIWLVFWVTLTFSAIVKFGIYYIEYRQAIS